MTLLTGQLVFEAKSPARLMHMHIKAAPIPPSQRTELPIPPELDAIVLDCLAKSAGDRPADANTLRERLAALGIADQWSRARARHWWDAHRPQTLKPCAVCDGEHVIPAMHSE